MVLIAIFPKFWGLRAMFIIINFWLAVFVHCMCMFWTCALCALLCLLRKIHRSHCFEKVVSSMILLFPSTCVHAHTQLKVPKHQKSQRRNKQPTIQPYSLQTTPTWPLDTTRPLSLHWHYYHSYKSLVLPVTNHNLQREWEELFRVRQELGQWEMVSVQRWSCWWLGWVVEHYQCLSTSVFPM